MLELLRLVTQKIVLINLKEGKITLTSHWGLLVEGLFNVT